MTRTELRTIVKVAIGNRTDLDSTINSYLALGLDEAVKVHPFRSVLTGADLTLDVSVEDEFVTLPATCYRVIEARAIRDTGSSLNAYQLPILLKQEAVEAVPNLNGLQASNPAFCYQEGLKLYILPRATADHTIRFTYIPIKGSTWFADDNTANPIAILDTALIAFATANIFRLLEQFQSALEWDKEWERKLRSAVLTDSKSFGERIVGKREPLKMVSLNPKEDPFARNMAGDSF